MMVTNIHTIWQYQTKEVSNAPLVLFRILFGMLMTGSIVRFMLNGWIEEFYILPNIHFPYYGFEWIVVLPGWMMYLLFVLMLVSAICIGIGAFYRYASVMFFLSFTYVELIDKTYYLNHYYFISLVAFILIWLPAGRRFSFDAWRNPNRVNTRCRRYEISVLRLQIGVVYCFAGIAKLNADWLIRAMPLKIWLPANSHLPVIGSLLIKPWVAYIFSWFGAIYDLTVPFLLSIRLTRWYAYASVIVFHTLTAILFPIGVFPFVMICCAIIFFPIDLQENWLAKLEARIFNVREVRNSAVGQKKWKLLLFGVFVLIQVLMPWRYLLYPGRLFWHEQGYRFSWRVMLMEKMGQATFYVTKNGHKMVVDNTTYLTPLQEKMMSTQPDMILQYAHFLEQEYKKRGFENPEVFTEAYVTLNGRRSRKLIDDQTDLTKLRDGWSHKNWVLNYE